LRLEVVSLPLGAYQTNCYVVSTEGSTDAVVIDPGDDAETVRRVLAERGLTLRAILVTHGHLDHIGAVRDLAESAGVEVWMARGDADDLRTFAPAPYEPQHLVAGVTP
jgi:hydroxyacylglutathione hydrolase